MSPTLLLLGLFDIPNAILLPMALIAAGIALVFSLLAFNYGRLWLQAKFANAEVSLRSLVGMSLRHVKPSTIVKARVMASQAGLTISQGKGMSTSLLESHYLAGGDVNRVIQAIISANRAGIDLDFDRAAAIDLSGRDLEEAVRTSIFPKVIDCPDPNSTHSPTSLSAVAKNGIELLTQVRVTVRTNLDQLVGGATEQTIIARVGQGIISTIGSMDSHEEALATPSRISETVFDQGIQSNTAYEIVSIDVSSIKIGRNIGARLQTEQAEADAQVARANAEMRRANAIALLAEMHADVIGQRAELILAQADVPAALAEVFREGPNDFDWELLEDSDDSLKLPASRKNG